MRTRTISLVCSALLVFITVAPARAGGDVDSTAVIADVIVGRPLCFAATVVGSAFFVVALPFALFSKSVAKTGDVLVGKPARATFTRPLGDFNQIGD